MMSLRCIRVCDKNNLIPSLLQLTNVQTTATCQQHHRRCITSYSLSSTSSSSASSSPSPSPLLSLLNRYTVRRDYHVSTMISLAKKDKKNKKGSDDDNDSNNDDIGSTGAKAILPDIKTTDGHMDRKIDRLIDEFTKLRAGKASTDMFNSITFDTNDNNRMKIVDACQISLKSSSKITINVYDPLLTTNISNAIRDAGLGLNPTVEGSTLAINIPRPSKESRETLVKAASKAADKGKLDIRNVRKDAMDVIKKAAKSTSEDIIRKLTKDIDTLTEKKIDRVSKLLKEKESEILNG